MSALATIDHQDILEGWAEHEDEPSLESFITGTWRELRAHQLAACPMCGGELLPTYGAHALPIAGRCGECGTELR